mgnify:CR=1 FL=1
MDRVEEELLKLDLLTDEVENPEQLVKAIKEEDWAKVKRMTAEKTDFQIAVAAAETDQDMRDAMKILKKRRLDSMARSKVMTHAERIKNKPIEI